MVWYWVVTNANTEGECITNNFALCAVMHKKYKNIQLLEVS